VRAEKKEKVYIEIDAHFERPSRGGRGRGGDRDRGRGRGGRGRGRGAGGYGANGTATPAVNVDDENAFPSLS
jgi:plasminogen activator inhibitor 1 RNA-binding protein